jgi:hypothetical protein
MTSGNLLLLLLQDSRRSGYDTEAVVVGTAQSSCPLHARCPFRSGETARLAAAASMRATLILNLMALVKRTLASHI